MDEKQRKAIQVRLALRSLAIAGLAAVCAQVAIFAYLAKQEVAGTFWKSERFQVADLTISLQLPNTWRFNLSSAYPEIRIDLFGPAGVRGQMVASRGALAALPVLEESDLQKLPERVHKAMARRLFGGYGDVKEDSPETSTALETPGVVSFFESARDGLPYRGVRYSWVDNGRAWGLVLASPVSKWEESVPVFSRITGKLKVASQ